MSKCLRRNDAAAGIGHANGKVGSSPYTVAARRERSRELAQKRRTTYKSVMEDLTQALPFPKDVVSQLDYNSRLRLSLCFFRLKTLLANDHTEPEPNESSVASGGVDDEVDREVWSGGETKSSAVVRHKVSQPGMLQSMMAEALDGFLLVTSSDGTIVYLSESVHHHLGIFQSEHIGINIYDIISEDDHEDVQEAVAKAETEAMFFSPGKRSVQVEFFCRMKCSRFKVANTITKSPGFKVVHVSGSIKVMRGSHFLVTVVRPVSPPSILEIRMEANMFVTHFSMELKCVFFDGRLRHFLGYKKQDIEGRSPFHFHHHDDVTATVKCGKGIVDRGEGLSGYYRFLTQFGYYLWVQTRGSLMYDSRTSKPTHLVCLNYIISKDRGERDLEIRQAITANFSGLSESSTHSYDPFPVLRTDGSVVNPLRHTSWKHKFDSSDYDLSDYLTGKKEKGVEPKGDTVVVKEEMPLWEQSDDLESPPDSGVHSDSSCLVQSRSHCGSTSTVFSSPVGSPDSSGPSPNDSARSFKKVLSPSDSDLVSSQSLPDSTSDLEASTSAADNICAEDVGNPTSSHDQHSVFSPEGSLSSVAEYQRQVPLGQAPLRQASPEHAQRPIGLAQMQCPTGKAQSLGQPPLGEGLPAWDQSPSSIQPDTASIHVPTEKYDRFHSDTVLPETFFVQENGSAYQFQNGEPILYQQQDGLEYGVDAVPTEFNEYPRTSCNAYIMGTAQKTYPQTYPQTSNSDRVIKPHPEVSFKQYSMNATATVEMINIPSSFTQQCDPSPSTNQSELQKLLTQQVRSHDAELPNLSPCTGVWSADAGTLPQLTGEDLEMLDFVAKI